MSTSAAGVADTPSQDRRLTESGSPRYFGGKGAERFGWLHLPETPARGSLGVVVCGTYGYETLPSHRALRRLSVSLADAGIPTIRFDYRSAGDSADLATDPSLASLVEDIGAAVEELKRATGVRHVVLVGFRLGALLAQCAMESVETAGLVAWGPVIEGRRFIREWQTIARMSVFADTDRSPGGLLAGGFKLSDELANELRDVNLLTADLDPETPWLLVQRDDVNEGQPLVNRLQEMGVPVQSETPEEFAGIVTEPHYTEIPTKSISLITDWVGSLADDQPPSASGPADRERVCEMTMDWKGTSIRERIAGPPDSGIPAVVTEPEDSARFTGHTLLFLNAGSVHRIGPNRMYVQFARDLAAAGIQVCRFDSGGVGDRAAGPGCRENDPYCMSVPDDIERVVRWIRESPGVRRLTLSGLCSGAWAAFHGGLKIRGVSEVILINPLAFYWEEGMSLAQPSSQHYANVAYYRQSMRDWRKWVRLLAGRSNIRKLLSVTFGRVRHVLSGWWELVRGSENPLEDDLFRMEGLGVRISFIFSDGDPGRDILRNQAPQATHRMLALGSMRKVIIPRTDHTFKPVVARAALGELLLEWVTEGEQKAGRLKAVPAISLNLVRAQRFAIRVARNKTRQALDHWHGLKVRAGDRWPSQEPMHLVVGSESSGTTAVSNLLFEHAPGIRFLEEGLENWVWKAAQQVYLGERQVKDFPRLQLFDAIKVPRFATILPQFCEMFPNTHVAYMVRDPRDMVDSAMKTFGLSAVEDLQDIPWVREDWLGIEARHPVERLAWRWRLYLELADRHPAVEYVRYEDFCADKLGVLEDLAKKTGVPLNRSRVIRLLDRQLSPQRKSYRPRGPGGGKRLRKEELALVESICGDHMATWGYR